MQAQVSKSGVNQTPHRFSERFPDDLMVSGLVRSRAQRAGLIPGRAYTEEWLWIHDDGLRPCERTPLLGSETCEFILPSFIDVAVFGNDFIFNLRP